MWRSVGVPFQIVMSDMDHCSQQYGGDGVYGLSGGMDGGRFNSYGFEAAGRGGAAVGSTGSTALYHHNGAKYGFNMNGRANGGADGKMNGLHGPKHKRGDIDRECTSLTTHRCARLGDVDVVLTKYVQSTGSREHVWRISLGRSRNFARTSMAAATSRRSLRRVCRNTAT